MNRKNIRQVSCLLAISVITNADAQPQPITNSMLNIFTEVFGLAQEKALSKKQKDALWLKYDSHYETNEEKDFDYRLTINSESYFSDTNGGRRFANGIPKSDMMTEKSENDVKMPVEIRTLKGYRSITTK